MSRILLVAAGTVCLFALAVQAATNDYALKPSAVADGIYVLPGLTENFSRENGGNIVNTGFIVGSDGVIVIDTGPSRDYGRQQRASIATVTPLPVRQVYITHAHPDHFLGDQAYSPDLIAALPGTSAAIRKNGELLSDNLYRLVGGWMIGTEVVAPSQDAVSGPVTIAGRKLKLMAAAGHTDSDLMIFDEATKTLFTGDLVFHRRAATTPNADIARWLATLDEIDKLDFVVLVPGHGPVVRDHAAIAETRDYLRWLTRSLREAAAEGLDMAEVMNLPLPERFQSLSVVRTEYTRSVSHLYPAIELEALPPVVKSTP